MGLFSFVKSSRPILVPDRSSDRPHALYKKDPVDDYLRQDGILGILFVPFNTSIVYWCPFYFSRQLDQQYG